MGMSFIDGGQNLQENFDDSCIWHRVISGNIFLEVRSVNIFHYQVLHPVVFINVIDIDNVGIYEFGQRVGFTSETSDCRLIVTQIKTQKLNGNITIQNQVMCQVNVGHASFAKRSDDFVAPA